MRAALIVVAVLLGVAALLGFAKPAFASPCGGGSSSGGSSSSSGGSSDGGSSSDGGDSEPACVEESEIVGRSTCGHRFGAWDRSRVPALRIGIGTSFHRLSVDGMAGTARHESESPFVLSSSAGEAAERAFYGASFDLHIVGPLGRFAYIGGQLSMGAGGVTGDEIALATGATVQPRSGLLVEGGVLAGVALPLGDRVSIYTEAVAGGRVLTVTTATTHGTCESTASASRAALLLKPRAGIAAWLSPQTSISVDVGTSLLEPDDISVGINIRGHLRAFDNLR